MLLALKEKLYFPLAYYFRFWAQIQLSLWKPTIIVITGSSGKTTLLHLVESQIGKKAKYSHHANSTYGIPFDILGIKRTKLTKDEWLPLLFLAPFKAFKPPIKEKLYIVEADCDRPGEGKFLASLLKPNVTLWVNSSKTHSMNFDNLIKQGKFETIDEAIAFEFGYFLEYCKTFASLNGDNPLMADQIKRSKAKIEEIKKENHLQKYQLTKNGTQFDIDQKSYHCPFILPEDVFYSIGLTLALLDYLQIKSDDIFEKFSLPPGRSSLFAGIKATTIIDSTYNANLGSMLAILTMFAKFPTEKKWVILSDMLELGNEEKEEHEKLAKFLTKIKLERIILVGKRTAEYTFPILNKLRSNVISFIYTKDAKAYIEKNLDTGDVLLFKGSQSMLLEGLIEPLLKNKDDIAKLPRREIIWEERRKKAGL